MPNKKELTKTFHIIFDAIDCDKEMISDEKFIFNLLLEIPKLIEMKILSGPNIIKDYDQKNLGITGFAIISYSHISIHTFTKTREIFVDIFSCKEFDYQKVRTYLYNKLNISEHKVQTQEINYPWRE